MKTKEEYLHHLWETDPEQFNAISEFILRDQLGIAHPLTGGGCEPSVCHDRHGCEPATNNGYCACVGGACKWVPAA